MNLLTIKQAANIAVVHPDTIRRWVRTGRLLSFKWGNKPQSRVRISSESLAEACGVSSSSPRRVSQEARDRERDAVLERLGMRPLNEHERLESSSRAASF